MTTPLENSVHIHSPWPGVLSVTLNQPKTLNALHPSQFSILRKLHKSIPKDTQCVLLRGSGGNFCSGADLRWMLKKQNPLSHRWDCWRFSQIFESIRKIPVPVIAYAEGISQGAGVGLLACADGVWAHPDASFHCPEKKWGILPAIIMPYIMQKIGHHSTFKLVGTASGPIHVEEAQRMGLILEVLPPENIQTQLQPLLQMPPHVARELKTLLLRNGNHFTAAQKMFNAFTLARLRQTPHARQRLSSFFKKI